MAAGSSSVRFTVRSPDRAYKDRWLWIPNQYPTGSIKSSLELDTGMGMRQLWNDTGNHLVVPREFPWDGPVTVIRPNAQHVGFTDSITCRDASQQAAWDALSSATGGVLNLSPGKGKTVLGLKKIAKEQVKSVVVVPGPTIISQWVEQAQKFLGLSRNDIGIVQASKAQWDRPLVIAALKTLAIDPQRVPLKVIDSVGLTIFDEVHRLGATTFSRAAPIFGGMRLGLTATIEREDRMEQIYLWHLGDVIHSDLSQDIPLDVYFVETMTRINEDETRKHCTDKARQFNFSMFYRWLGKQTARNRLIAEHVTLAIQKGRKVIVLGSSIEGLAMLSVLLPGSLVIDGETPHHKRIELLRRHNPVLATQELLSEAVDVKEIDTVMFVTPFRAWRWFQQGSGRGQRIHAGKDKAVIVVFDDIYIPPARALLRTLKKEMKGRGIGYTSVTTE